MNTLHSNKPIFDRSQSRRPQPKQFKPAQSHDKQLHAWLNQTITVWMMDRSGTLTGILADVETYAIVLRQEHGTLFIPKHAIRVVRLADKGGVL